MIQTLLSKVLFAIPRKVPSDRDDLFKQTLNSISNFTTIVCPDTLQLGPGHALRSNLKDIYTQWEYLAVFDDDDILIEENFIKLIEEMEKNPSVPFGESAYKIMNFDSVVSDKVYGTFKQTQFSLLNTFKSRGLKVYRTQFLKAVGGFDPTIKYSYDWEVCRKLAFRYGDPFHLDLPTFCYRVHENQICSQDGDFEFQKFDFYLGVKPPK